MDNIFASLMVLLVSILVSRIISERALKKLNSEEKIKLFDAFSNMRMYSMMPLVMLILMLFMFKHVYFLFAPAILAYMLILNIFIFRKLKRIDIPKNIVGHFMFARSIAFVGFLAFLFIQYML